MQYAIYATIDPCEPTITVHERTDVIDAEGVAAAIQEKEVRHEEVTPEVHYESIAERIAFPMEGYEARPEQKASTYG